MFRFLRSVVMRGLVAVLPIGLTLYLLWWLAVSTERLPTTSPSRSSSSPRCGGAVGNGLTGS